MQYSYVLATAGLLVPAALATTMACPTTLPITATLRPAPDGTCYFSSTTVTSTRTVECGGCPLTTEFIGGHGPACKAESTAPGTTTVETAVCATAPGSYGGGVGNGVSTSPFKTTPIPVTKPTPSAPKTTCTSTGTIGDGSTFCADGPRVTTIGTSTPGCTWTSMHVPGPTPHYESYCTVATTMSTMPKPGVTTSCTEETTLGQPTTRPFPTEPVPVTTGEPPRTTLGEPISCTSVTSIHVPGPTPHYTTFCADEPWTTLGEPTTRPFPTEPVPVTTGEPLRTTLGKGTTRPFMSEPVPVPSAY